MNGWYDDPGSDDWSLVALGLGIQFGTDAMDLFKKDARCSHILCSTCGGNLFCVADILPSQQSKPSRDAERAECGQRLEPRREI
jgi:hypothetical protein